MADTKEIIRRAMADQGVNVPELARRCGLNQGTLYQWLQGRRPRGLTTETLEKVIAALGLSLQ